MPPLRSTVTALLLLVVCATPSRAQKEYGFDNRKPSGQPYLKPEESVRRMKAAEGFEVKLFAAEPMVVNPVAMTVDEKGRVWVIECFEYPKRTAKGKMPRDRIVILEDTKGTGVADKRTVFAEGKDFPVPFDLATGLEVGNGGVYVGAPPYLFFIENKNDKPGKFEILLKGFGSQDTHETLNTFQWGPDGKLYGLHGIFTNSVVKPEQADGPGTRLNGGIWRYDTRTKKFEIFAEGTSNPWGMDWRNTDGQFILCCCVIPHLFHISPGGVYKRQAGQSFNDYTYGYINEICDHTFHKESGWAHAGLISLDTPIMPEKYRNSVIFGSIHGCSIKQNILKKNGSTYIASRGDDFVVSGDKNFRPINLRWGPNGEIYCIDWHDQNPCHQAGADSWDYEHGRVFRIQTKGLVTKKAEDLGRLSVGQLVTLLVDSNPWKARTAMRLLAERRQELTDRDVNNLRGGVAYFSLKALTTLGATGRLDEKLAAGFLSQFNRLDHNEPALRGWTIRLLGENGTVSDAMFQRFVTIAKDERAPEVRLQLASTALRLLGGRDCSALLHALMQHKEDATDHVIPQMLWLAFEKRLSKGHAELDWLKENAAGNALVLDTILPRTMRRLASGGKAEDLKACLTFVAGLKDGAAKRKALEGLTIALKGRQVDAPANWKMVYAALLKDDDGEVKKLAQALAINFRDAGAARAALSVARDPKKPLAERAAAVRDLGVARIDEAKQPLLNLLLHEKDVALRQEACRSLAGYDGNDIATTALTGWKEYPAAVRAEVVNLLAGRKEWAALLLTAVGEKRVPRTDLNDNTILRIRALKDRKLDAQITTVWGKIRDTPAELNQLINAMHAELYKGPASFERGRKVFDNQCAKCHTFDGRGHTVGPALDGAGRDIEYLLVNVLDPNRVVGSPYFQRVVTTNKGQVFVGLLAAEDKETISLKSENDAIRVFPRKEVEKIEIVERSMMPEGLDKTMTTQDFRDLIRYVMVNPFLSAVAVSGPFADAGPAFDPSAVSPTMKWLPLTAGAPGRIALPATKNRGVAYVRAEFTTPEALKTRLLLGAGQTLKVWLNGKVVYEGRAGTGSAAPDQAAVDVELPQGENRLYFRVSYAGDKEAVYARFLDPNRKIRYPEAK